MRLWTTFLVVMAVSDCATSSEVDALREDQRRLLDRVEQLEKKLADSDKGRGNRPSPDRVYKVPVGNSPSSGKADAPITIIEFGEFQCPFCARVQPTIARLRRAYGDAIRVVWKHNPLPFHARAMPAALASECAHAQGQFWGMHDALFDRAATLSDEDFNEAALDLGLDMDAFHACLLDDKTKERISTDMILAEDVDARGTPSFFINGHSVVGAQPYEAFARVVDDELRKKR